MLRWLAGLVAFIGILAALMALQLERARELGVLRANGMTPGQVVAARDLRDRRCWVSPPGCWRSRWACCFAAVMVQVINRRSFGWTLEMAVAPEVLLQAVALSLVAALLAGVYPAWRMARTSPAAALREE